MSADLRLGTHAGGSKSGEEIFRFLLSAIKPKALIVHGAGASKQLASILDVDLGNEPISANDLRLHYYDAMLIVVIRSLAPPAYYNWSSWAAEHLQNVTRAVAKHMR